MKKCIAVFVLCLFGTGIMSGCRGGAADDPNSMAEEDARRIFKYEELKDQGLRIQAYTGKEKVVAVPEQIGDRKVTEIGTGAFKNSQVEKITIPATVKTIESWAFYNLPVCKEITIGNKMSLKTDDIFLRCPKLQKVNTKGKGTIVWFIGNSLIAEGNLDMYFQDVCDQMGENVIHYTNTGDGYTLDQHMSDFLENKPETAYLTADYILIQPLYEYEDSFLQQFRRLCRADVKIYALGTMYTRYNNFCRYQKEWKVPLDGFTPGGDICDDLIQKKILDVEDIQSLDEVHPTYLNGFISGVSIYKELFGGDVRKVDYKKVSYSLEAFIPGETEEKKREKAGEILDVVRNFDREEYQKSGRASYEYSTEIKRGASLREND